MSGHSKWHSIKRKKGAADTKRGQEFTKLAKAISIAAKSGADPEMNFKLRLAIDKAKAANMPNANIGKAIARGSGQAGGEQIQEVVYEGYGPGGVAVMVECATDNRNRTYSDVRTVFSKHGGNVAESGAVAFQFVKQGVINIASEDADTTTLNAIDAGATDIESLNKAVTVYVPPAELSSAQSQLKEQGEKVESAELEFVPTQSVPISDAQLAQKVVTLLESLEDLDDVTSVSSNADFNEEVIKNLSV